MFEYPFRRLSTCTARKYIIKMKQSSTTHFGATPLDTNTLAGQWLTFSHMANHYRKLLNVKPRVDTGLLGGGIGSFRGSYHNLTTNSKMIQSSKTGKKKRNSTNGSKPAEMTTNDSNLIYNQDHHHHYQNHHRDRDRLIYSSHPDHLDICSSPSKNKPVTSALTIKSPLKNGRSKKKVLTSHFPEYQVVFGPSSIRSSSEGAFLSDDTASTVSNENNKPPLDVQTPIGVTEKIRRFLNHIHQLDLTTATSKPSISKKSKIRTGPLTPTASSVVTTAEKPVSAGTLVTTSNRESRHSKCFLPYEPSSPKSPRKCVSSSVTETVGNQLSSRKFAKSAHHFHQQQQIQSSPKLTRNKFTGSGGDIHTMIPEKDCSSTKRPKSRKRAESIASIGTIFGSEDLAVDYGLGDEDLLLQRIMDDNLRSMKANKKSPKKVLPEQDRHNRRGIRTYSTATSMMKSSSMASLIPSSSADGASVATFAKSHRHHRAGTSATINNKDSSRDSAYGFSSGESRITTRESTPEKKCSSDGLDFADMKPCKDVQTSYSKSHQSTRSTSTNDLRRRDSNERYITFLTDLTQDIVRKEIYTNKGLKKLFKSHLEQNKELNPNKLSDMVERLRMDLGIPKDDSLDKMEFGYGSVSELSSTTFFYTPSDPSHDKLSTESILLSAKTVASSSSSSGVMMTPSEGHIMNNTLSHQSSPSPTTIIPTTVIPGKVGTAMTSSTTGFSSSGEPNSSSNRSSTTGTAEEGSGVGDFNSVLDESEDNFIGDDKHQEDEGNDDELSLSETEVSQYLKVAGLDVGTMQSVMGILKS